MHLTKQQKIAAVFLVLAVAALVTDRFIIGHDDDDSAALVTTRTPRQPAPAAHRPAPRPAKPAPAPEAELACGNVAALADRLEATRASNAFDLDAVRDAFRPPVSMVGARKVESVDELQMAAKRFVERHKLGAVIRKQSGGGVAVIEDKMLSVGQSLDGFVLVAVKDRSAVLRRGNQRVELRLQDDSGAATITPSEKVAGVDAGK
jgi:hypothetical protein